MGLKSYTLTRLFFIATGDHQFGSEDAMRHSGLNGMVRSIAQSSVLCQRIHKGLRIQRNYPVPFAVHRLELPEIMAEPARKLLSPEDYDSFNTSEEAIASSARLVHALDKASGCKSIRENRLRVPATASKNAKAARPTITLIRFCIAILQC